MKDLCWNFKSKDTKQPFYDTLDFTLKVVDDELKLVNNNENMYLDEDFNTSVKKDKKNNQQIKKLNKVEISYILQDYIEKYPDFIHQQDKKINHDKLEKDMNCIEKQIFMDQFIQDEKYNDIFNEQTKEILIQDKKRIEIKKDQFFDKIPQIQPKMDNLQNFMKSVEIDMKEAKQIENKKEQKLKFQARKYKNYSENLISQGQDKSIFEIDGYLKSIEMAKQYPFELDEFQKRAIYFIEKNQDVFVAAHTSAGKTVVAEYAIAKSLKNKSKVIFTSPIKALSNQKYYEFQQKFNRDVGIITGDVVLNQESSCLIMTTEILRNKLFKKCDSLENLEWVIFDEVHYINDMERGSVWEETIILLPKNVGIVMLSATVENVGEFADWVTRTTGKKLNVLRTYHRPVPLVHHIFYGKEVTIKQHGKDFDELAYRQMLKDIEAEKKKKKMKKDMKRKQLIQKKLELMKKSNQKERVKKITRNRTEKNKFYFSKEIKKMPLTDDRNSMKLINMVKKLNEKQKLPAIVFIFSKKKLNTLAEKASENLNLVTPDERKQISVFFERSIRRLKPEDKQILQIQSLKKMLLKGIGMHHGDLLWICKEIVELLFTKNLLKLLFATESFAMGINVPTKTVIFYTIEKNDGQSFRILKSGEYTQMCGRAGRRGIDTEGNVYIFFGDTNDIPQTEKIRPMLQNRGEVLESKFKLTYPTIINSFTMNNFKVKDLMKKSFTENKSYLKIIALKSRNALLKEEKKEFQVRCKYADENPLDLQEEQFIVYHKKLIDEIQKLNKTFYQDSSSKQIAKMFKLPGLFLVMDNNSQLHPLIIENYRIDKNDIYFDSFFIEDASHATNISLNKSPIKKTQFIQQNDLNIKINNYEIYFNDIILPLKFIEVDDLTQYEKLQNILISFKEVCKKKIPQDIEKTLSIKLDSHYDQIKQICQKITENKCYSCDELKDHFSILNKRNKIDLEFEENDKKITKEEGSFGIDQFNSLLNILQELKFLDENKLPNMNMKFAKALSSGPEVILLTFVFNNHLLANLEPFEIPPLLSLVCMVGKKYPDYDKLDELIESQSFSENLVKSIDSLVDCFQMVKQKELQNNIVFEDYIAFDMVLPIYQWSSGCDFRMLCTFTDRMEGYIVRIISKIEKYMEGLKALYQEQKNIEIVQKIELANQLLRRDILNAQSLYLN